MMIAALLSMALARDEVTDLIAKMRAASQTERYRIANDLSRAVGSSHVRILHAEIDKGPPELRVLLIRSFGRIRTKEAQDALRALCLKHEPASRAEAAYYLRVLGDESGMKILAALLPTLTETRDKMTLLSKFYGFVSTEVDVVGLMVRILGEESDVNLRRQAVQVLSYLKSEAAISVLEKLAEAEDEPVRFVALAGLIRMGADPSAVDAAVDALEGGKLDAASASYLINAIQMSGRPSVLPRLRALLEKTTDTSLLSMLINALVYMKDGKALAAFGKLAMDKNPAVARAAMGGVIRLAGRGHEDILKTLLEGTDVTQRLEAAEALLHLGRTEGYAGIKPALEGDASPWRLHAVRILASVRRSKSVDLLIPLLQDENENVKTQTRQALEQILVALFPYRKFDPDASPGTIREWWESRR